MAEAIKPDEEKAQALEDLTPEVVLTGKETPEELKTMLAEKQKALADERKSHKGALEAKKQLTARAHKAEKELKGEDPTPPAPPVPPADPTVALDERILKSQGMPDEVLTHLKKVAALQKVSLIDAQTDPLFTTFKEKFDKEKKSNDASLRGSRGSGKQGVQKDISAPGLSRDDHKAMFEERLANGA